MTNTKNDSEIDSRITAMADYCRGGHCAQCKYLTKKETCKLLDWILFYNDFPYPADIEEDEDDEEEEE